MKNSSKESEPVGNTSKASTSIIALDLPKHLPAADDKLPKMYHAGSLRYTLRGLVVLFLWLLWGDFAFTFFESIFGRFVPLYLKNLHASNSLIGVMTGSIAGAVNIFFLPNISQWSDHHRSRMGRRIPFLYAVTPLAAGALAGVGFAPEIADWLHAAVLSRLAPSVSIVTVILTLLCGFIVSFHFFNMMLVNTYNWLLRDVVPLELMSRFLSWFRIVGNISTCIFLWYVFPQVVAYRKEVCGGVSLFYLVSFLLMCRYVREGEYPPPVPVEDRPGILKSFVLYFRNCLSVPLYRNFFIVYILIILASSCAGPFNLLFYRNTLGMSLDDMGKIFAYGSGMAAIAFYPVGWLCDKFSPMRVALVSLVCMVFQGLSTYFFVVDARSCLILSLVFCGPAVGWALGSIATTMMLFPKEEFGQFSSGLNVFGCGALLFGNYLAGALMDLTHSQYRLIFMWSTALTALAVYPMLLVYRGWKQHGGPNRYMAPLPPAPLTQKQDGIR